MTNKLYSVAEANALLPYLAPTLVELREKFEAAQAARESVARAAAGNGWSEKRERWSTTIARVEELMERLTEWAIELRDISTGLVDFPAVLHGEEVYLCWRLGEPEVAYYHSRTEGFGGRRRL
ncbi:MAG TPA: DUF2203 domain-containing protein [Actinomycetota bacterium]|nr:DUF2203 domain-containing protein [Actinomycetota bacterium]